MTPNPCKDKKLLAELRIMKQFAKVMFDLEITEDGFPPIGSETLNCIVMGNGLFKIDNAPFFAERVSLNDIVRAERIEGNGERYVFEEVKEWSGNQSVSVIFLNDGIRLELKRKLENMGCYCEYGEFGRFCMLAVSVWKTIKYENIKTVLEEYESKDMISYSELAIY